MSDSDQESKPSSENQSLSETSENLGTESQKVTQGEHENGILRVRNEFDISEEEKQTMQEHHNANHALWYFSTLVDAAVKEKENRLNEKKTQRITAHLKHLQAFIRESKTEIKVLVDEILKALEKENPQDFKSWIEFLAGHWQQIYDLAEHFGHHETCFPDASRVKIFELKKNLG